MGIVEFEKSFAIFASKVSKWTGSSAAFFVATLFILGWGISGPYFGFSPKLANGGQYGNHYCNLPYGVRHSEQSEPRRLGASN